MPPSLYASLAEKAAYHRAYAKRFPTKVRAITAKSMRKLRAKRRAALAGGEGHDL